jgi:hypothetical protein
LNHHQHHPPTSLRQGSSWFYQDSRDITITTAPPHRNLQKSFTSLPSPSSMDQQMKKLKAMGVKWFEFDLSNYNHLTYAMNICFRKCEPNILYYFSRPFQKVQRTPNLDKLWSFWFKPWSKNILKHLTSTSQNENAFKSPTLGVLEHFQQCSICDLAKIFVTSKFTSLLFFPAPPIKTKTRTTNWWEYQ